MPQIGTLLWIQAFNKRLGTSGLLTPELYQESYNQGMPRSSLLPTVGEKDEWLYKTLRYGEEDVGRSMVCCVFACSMLKAGGVLANLDINCGELTNYDLASMAIFDKGGYSQILGDYTLSLNDFNSRVPYDHYAENCPDQPPYFIRP